MKIHRQNLLFLFILLLCCVQVACRNAGKYAPLRHYSSAKIEELEDRALRDQLRYARYLRTVSTDPDIHTKKEQQQENYPWKAGLSKQTADDFLSYLQRTLTAEKVHESAFGEMGWIESRYSPLMANEVMADLLTCQVVNYNLVNSKGEKITLDGMDVSVNKNYGALAFELNKRGLARQKITGEVALEITLPYTLFKTEVRPGDGGKKLDFGPTRIQILEAEDNVLHYQVEDDKDYETKYLIDNCSANTAYYVSDNNFYLKARKKPDLSYDEFVKDSLYFKPKGTGKTSSDKVRILYFKTCDPTLIYLYGYQKSQCSRRTVTIPINVDIQ